MIAITQQIKSDVTPEPTNKFIYVLVLTWQALISGGNQNNWLPVTYKFYHIRLYQIHLDTRGIHKL